MEIAVVILNWNGKKLLQQFLPSIIEFSVDAKIYVADNASTDDSIGYILEHFPTVNVIKNEGNFGYAKGYNEALKGIESDIFALVNSDVQVTKNWLQPIIEKFKNEPQTAVIQPKILDYNNKEKFEYAGAAGGYIDRFGYAFCRGRIFETIEHDKQQYDDDCEIFWASGACFFVRKDVFNVMGGFDADFFAHQEEIDLCWRILNAGYKVQYVSESVVYHVGGATLTSSNPRKTFLNFRNSLLMLTKNLPKVSLIPILFARLCLDGFAGIKFIFEGKFLHCVAIVKAHFSFYILIFRFLRKRQVNQLAGYYKVNSIVFTYYLKNDKFFDKIF